jgi:hypothetical protein
VIGLVASGLRPEQSPCTSKEQSDILHGRRDFAAWIRPTPSASRGTFGTLKVVVSKSGTER